MNLFDKIKLTRPKRSKFDLSHEKKMSFNMGNLIPIVFQEVLPGESFKVNSEIMIRLAPMLAPMMHRVNIFTHYFFVPNRLVWDEWEDFITGGPEGITQPVPPYIEINTSSIAKTSGLLENGTLADFMGLPFVDKDAAVGLNYAVSGMPFRAYQLIFNEYYRDQNLQAVVPVSKTSGEMTDIEIEAVLTLRQRCWEKDYFTSALPWAQRGPEVKMPVEAEGVVTVPSGYIDVNSDAATGNLNVQSIGLEKRLKDSAGNDISEITGLGVELDDIATTINDLRRASRLQEWLEKNARGGARYVEQILSHFGVRSSDARLQRPEYLGGGKAPVVISEVLQTMQNETGNPLGQMGGHGIGIGNTNGFKRSFEEHGYIIGIMSVLPRTNYSQGIPRSFIRVDKFDYAWPEFANIGEQEIKSYEVYFNQPGVANSVFGYQSRYAEYKYQPSTVHGAFRDSLAYWHMGRIFESAPALNESFVKSDPTTRIFAVGDDDPTVEHLYAQIYNHISALRPLPYFGTPSL